MGGKDENTRPTIRGSVTDHNVRVRLSVLGSRVLGQAVQHADVSPRCH